MVFAWVRLTPGALVLAVPGGPTGRCRVWARTWLRSTPRRRPQPVEPPVRGDGDEEAYGGYFQSDDRGKRSLELHLGTDEDREAFLSLVERADVVVENFKAVICDEFRKSW